MATFINARELTDDHVGRFISYSHPKAKYAHLTPSGTLESVTTPMANGRIGVVTRHADGWKTTHFLPMDHAVRIYEGS